MGKTPKPLDILLTDPSLLPLLQPYIDKGHSVVVQDCTRYDLILGPNCWRMDERLGKYLELAIKEARKEKYPKKGGKDASEE